MQPATQTPKNRPLVIQPAVALPAAPPYPALELLRSGHPATNSSIRTHKNVQIFLRSWQMIMKEPNSLPSTSSFPKLWEFSFSFPSDLVFCKLPSVVKEKFAAGKSRPAKGCVSIPKSPKAGLILTYESSLLKRELLKNIIIYRPMNRAMLWHSRCICSCFQFLNSFLPSKKKIWNI